MWWVIIAVRTGGKVARAAPGVAVKAAKHVAPGWVQQPGPAGSSPSHGQGSLWVVLAILLVLISLPLMAGGVAGWRGKQDSPRVRALRYGSLVASKTARQVKRAMPPAAARKVPVASVTQRTRIAATIFASGCVTCAAVIGQPCKMIQTPEKFVVIDPERNWGCHRPRVKKGCDENPDLYVQLMATWEGTPGELEGLLR